MKKYICFTLAILINIAVFMPSLLRAETLRLLIWGEYATQEHQQKFINLIKEKFNVDLKLEVSFANGNDDFFPMLRDSKFDIVSPVHHIPKDERFQLISLKLVLPVNLENISNYKNILSSLQKLEACTENGEVYGVPSARGTYSLVYNTGIVKEPPTTWNVLWDPLYKGKFAIGKDHYDLNIFITALAMGIPPEKISSYKELNYIEFQDKLAQLAINVSSFWEGIDSPDILKGLAIATSFGSSIPLLKERGETWKIAETKEASIAFIDHMMISHTLKDKPLLKRIAEEWLNYILSDESQIYMAEKRGLVPTVTTINDKLSPEFIERYHLNDPSYFEKHFILWPILKKMDRKGFERLWEKALDARAK